MSTEDNTTIGHLFAEDQPSAPVPAEQVPQHAPMQMDAPIQSPAVTPPAPVVPAEPQPVPHQVPLAELISERRERQQLAQQNRELMEAISRLSRPQQPAPQPIDPVADPELAFHSLEQRMSDALLNQSLNFSESRARDKYGNDAVEQALDAALRNGYAETFKRRPDPYGEMVAWHQSQRVAQEIGTDPAAYRAKVEAEVRAQILAQMRTGQAVPPNLPPSLSSAAKANSAPEVVGSDKDFFMSSMNQRRG